MKNHHAFAVACALTLLCSCRDRGIRGLHERRYYAGEIEVEERQGGTVIHRWSGEVTFDRDADNYQLTLRRGDGTVSLSRGTGGAVVGFRDGIPGPVAARDANNFGQLMSLIESLPAGAQLLRGNGAYEIHVGERTTTVSLAARPYAHGK